MTFPLTGLAACLHGAWLIAVCRFAVVMTGVLPTSIFEDAKAWRMQFSGRIKLSLENANHGTMAAMIDLVAAKKAVLELETTALGVYQTRKPLLVFFLFP